MFRSQISDKLKAAKKSKHVKCVTVEWITDSIEKGYALPDTDYVVVRGTSTPTKQDEFVNPNFSTISAIGNTTHMLSMPNILQETAISTSDPNETESKKRKSTYSYNIQLTTTVLIIFYLITANFVIDIIRAF